MTKKLIHHTNASQAHKNAYRKHFNGSKLLKSEYMDSPKIKINMIETNQYKRA